MEADWNFIVDDIRCFEKDKPEIIQRWKQQIETGDEQNNIIALLEETLSDIDSETQWQMTYVLNIKFFWIILRYCLHHDYKGLRSWLDYQMGIGYNGVNAAFSKENILKYLVEKGKINSENLKAFKFDNITNGNSKSSKITEIILSDIEKVLSDNDDETKIIGFECNLPRHIIDRVYAYMNNQFLEADPNDFDAAFNNNPTRLRKPIKWLILNQRGINTGRGNQTALFCFLKLMLGDLSNEDRRKCSTLFIDNKGHFIENTLVYPDSIKKKVYGFEDKLNEIIKKAE